MLRGDASESGRGALPFAFLDQRRERLTLGEFDRPTDRRLVQFCWIDANGREYGGMQVANGDRIGRLRLAFRVGRADDLAGANSSTGERGTEAGRPVVAAARGVHHRRTA